MTSDSDNVENDNPFGIHVILNYTPQLERKILGFRVADEPGAQFRYNSGDNALLAMSLDRANAAQTIMDCPFNLPGNWPTQASKRAVQYDLPIQILCLPTYASWCNPIEKLWRWLRQDILHLHPLSDQRHELKQRVATFFDQFHCGSADLLHDVGLLPD